MSTGSYPFLDIAKQYNCDYALVLNCAELITHGNWQEFLDFHRQSAWHGELAGVVQAAVTFETMRRSRVNNQQLSLVDNKLTV